MTSLLLGLALTTTPTTEPLVLPETANHCLFITAVDSPNWTAIDRLPFPIHLLKEAVKESDQLRASSFEIKELSKGSYVVFDLETPLILDATNAVGLLNIIRNAPLDREMTLGSFQGKDRMAMESLLRKTWPHLKDGPLPSNIGVSFVVSSNFSHEVNGETYGYSGPREYSPISNTGIAQMEEISDKKKLNALIEESKTRQRQPNDALKGALVMRQFGAASGQKRLQLHSEASAWLRTRLDEAKAKLAKATTDCLDKLIAAMKAGGKNLPALGALMAEADPRNAQLLRDRAENEWRERGFESQAAAREHVDRVLGAPMSSQAISVMFYTVDAQGIRGGSEAWIGEKKE